MKKLLFILCIFIGSEAFAIDSENVQNKTNVIFNEMKTILLASKNVELEERFNFVMNKLSSNEVILTIDDVCEKNIFAGIGFSTYLKSNNKPNFYFYPEIFELYKTNPSIVMSAFMHEFQHCYDYYTNNELYEVSYTNKLEKYLFEMDAYHIEADFINNVLLQNKYTLTQFEELLRQSMNEDNLDYFSILIRNVNRNQLYGYISYANQNTLDTTISSYITDGNDIANYCQISESDDDWTRYQKMVIINTYTIFIPQLVFDITGNKTGVVLDPQKFSFQLSYPELYRIWNQISILSIKYGPILSEKNKNIINSLKM